MASLFGSKLREKVLGWLFTHPDERYFVRQLTNLLGEDSTNVSRQLARLEKTGVLISIQEGKQKYYQANRESPIFNELHGLMVKTAGVADILRSALVPATERIKLAFIFGSVANSSERRRSDIDVMIVGSISFDDTISLLDPAEEKLAREINPTVYPVSEFKQKIANGHPFLKRVFEGDKIFLIGDIRELTRLAGNRAIKST